MFKILILTCLIIQTYSWTWKDYPSPRGPNYMKCGVSRPTNVCDPDGMLTDQQREEIVQLVEDFKEKTKRPNSKFRAMRGGIELFVALAKDKIGDDDDYPSGRTHLCYNDKWRLIDEPKCLTVHGIELNTDGFPHSVWYWTKDPIYPSPRGADYWICRVTKPTWVCDPDRMLTDLQREEIIELVEDFKEKTKNPNSMFPCAREGLRLIVALAYIAIGDLPSTVRFYVALFHLIV
uniref:Uncharacterized protein n=1 Tax=Meloidogyne javanica TaxID=6303 RepID=A0A915N6F2_MELJA